MGVDDAVDGIGKLFSSDPEDSKSEEQKAFEREQEELEKKRKEQEERESAQRGQVISVAQATASSALSRQLNVRRHNAPGSTSPTKPKMLIGR